MLTVLLLRVYANNRYLFSILEIFSFEKLILQNLNSMMTNNVVNNS